MFAVVALLSRACMFQQNVVYCSQVMLYSGAVGEATPRLWTARIKVMETLTTSSDVNVEKLPNITVPVSQPHVVHRFPVEVRTSLP